jgi:hypothetical protein
MPTVSERQSFIHDILHVVNDLEEDIMSQGSESHLTVTHLSLSLTRIHPLHPPLAPLAPSPPHESSSGSIHVS